MSLLLDALKKAALEKKASSRENERKDECGPLLKSDEENNVTKADSPLSDVNSIQSINDIDISASAANEPVASIVSDEGVIHDEDSMELELEDGVSLNEIEEEGSISDCAEEDNQFDEPVEVQPNEAIADTGEASLEEEFKYEESNLQGNALADDILDQYSQQEKQPQDSDDESLMSEENVGISEGIAATIDQAAIDAMIEGAFCAREVVPDVVSTASAEETENSGATNTDSIKDNKTAATVSSEALDQLIHQADSERKTEKVRRIILGIVLFFVALGLGGLYYYVEVISDDMLVMPIRPSIGIIPLFDQSTEEGASDNDANPQDNTSVDNLTNKPKTAELRNSDTKSDDLKAQNPIKKATTKTKKIVTKRPRTPVARQKSNIIPVSPRRNRITSTNRKVTSKRKTRNKITKPLSVDKTLQQAYSAYHTDQVLQAKLLYQSALKRDKGNRDALLGLAAVATKLGEYDVALANYSKLLTVNPLDDSAQAGLLQISFQNASPNIETKLKLLIEKSPNSGFLRFALGNVYVRRSHWQQASFQFKESIALDPVNPDFAYNLGVSQDQLGNREQALFRYQQALSLSWRKNVGFSRDLLRKRIDQLSKLKTSFDVGGG